MAQSLLSSKLLLSYFVNEASVAFAKYSENFRQKDRQIDKLIFYYFAMSTFVI